MTAIVAIRCSDGVVIGADSSTTFNDGVRGTIEQITDRKIEIFGDQVIVAGTGYVGHSQRFCAVVQRLFDAKAFRSKSEIEIGKILSFEGIKDFRETHLNRIEYTSFVAYPAQGSAALCELIGGSSNFQPEVKTQEGLWFTSAGSGQQITDPFLALFKEVFWSDGPPNLQGGVFTALWALQHACKVNPGGIQGPERIAVLARERGGQLRARHLNEDELGEHRNMVEDATRYFGQFKDVLLGRASTASVPTP